jgi:hypothetical protein
MQSLESIIHEARAVRDMVSSEPYPDLRLQSAVINLANLVTALAENVESASKTARQAADTASCLANGIQPD